MMSRATTSLRTDHQEMTVGDVPRVVGVLCSLLGKFPLARQAHSCDLIEVRLDIAGRPAGWLAHCRKIQDAGWPVLLTIRLAAEGGQWKKPDQQRLDVFEQGLEAVAAVDVEWRSKIARDVATMAKKKGQLCVVSYHDFEKTPPINELARIVGEAQEIASIVKISTRLNNSAEDKILRALLARKWAVPLCVIGMGAAYARTRVQYPKLGSCLTYGYLDKATAPGQMSAAELSRQLRLPRKGKEA